MEISAVGYQPYIYNTNMVSAVSMNKIAAIPEDVTNQRIDYSGLVEDENVNPLGRGQSANFMDILASQMSRGKNNASLIMKNSPFETVDDQHEKKVAGVTEEMQEDGAVEMASDLMANIQNAGTAPMDVFQNHVESMNAGVNSAASANGGANLYQMNQAIAAYSMSMGIA